MTRVDFYELPDQGEEARARFACRLALKGRDAGLPVHLLVSDAAGAKDLDDLMWHYPRERFLPHGSGSEADTRARVQILVQAPAPDEDTQHPQDAPGEEDERGEPGLLINLTSTPPGNWQQFSRVAEIVVACTRDASRRKYRYYQKQVQALHHHRLDDWEA